MHTFAAIMTPAGVEIPAHLVAEAEIPVLSGVQRQGDLIIVPTRKGKDLGSVIPAAGVAVIRGESTGNTHLLVGDGAWRPIQNRGQDQGVVTVPDGGAAFLLHPEHGAQGLAPGSYLIRRQREQADEIRLVAD